MHLHLFRSLADSDEPCLIPIRRRVRLQSIAQVMATDFSEVVGKEYDISQSSPVEIFKALHSSTFRFSPNGGKVEDPRSKRRDRGEYVDRFPTALREYLSGACSAFLDEWYGVPWIYH